MARQYLVKTGLDYGGTRREPGEIADDIPPESVHWLEEQGLIEEADEKRRPEGMTSQLGEDS